MSINLKQHQIDALRRLDNGKILYGIPGSGKSRVAVAYYYIKNGGSWSTFEDGGNYVPMEDPPKDLYIITTAKKRDKYEWESELAPFLITNNEEIRIYQHKVVIDSWNNVAKYKDVMGAFFIFDEQRVVGDGPWAKSFIKITKTNSWILLSATPGDTWSDYIAVFIANGFYKNKTEFVNRHVIWKPYVPYRAVDRYIETGRLLRLRRNILVPMNFEKKTKAHDFNMNCAYDKSLYKEVMKLRQNPFKDWQPIDNASELCYVLREIVNSDMNRLLRVTEILDSHQRAIIFYNYDYELEALRALFEDDGGFVVGEWNGHKHQDVPTTFDPEKRQDRKWVYLVQYNAGAEGWNCTTTDTIIFFSQTYSYKQLEQAKGRIDRMNTPYQDLYYYHLKSSASIDLAISKALKNKKKFNEHTFVNG